MPLKLNSSDANFEQDFKNFLDIKRDRGKKC